MTIAKTDFFAKVLKAPLTNANWSWGAENDHAVFLTVWANEIVNGRTWISDMESDGRLGAQERYRHMKSILAGKKVFGVLLQKKDDKFGKGCTEDFDETAIYDLTDIRKEKWLYNGEEFEAWTAKIDLVKSVPVTHFTFNQEAALESIYNTATEQGLTTIERALSIGWNLVDFKKNIATLRMKKGKMLVDIFQGTFKRL